MIKQALGAVAGLALAASLAVVALPSGAADHLDAPAVKKDGRTDITDVYAFQSKEHAGNTVLIMDVNPLAGVVSGTSFDPKGTYEFLVDNDGDARADVTLSATFADTGHGQRVKVKRGNATVGNAPTGETFSLHGGGQAWAGLADDPFFFDLQAFNDQVKAAGGSRTFCDANAVDFFAGTNISAIVLEVPSSWLTGSTSNIGVWARTWHRGDLADQMGRPAINTVFVPSNLKDTFNATAPADMPAAFGQIFTDDLLALSNLDGSPYTEDQAEAITAILLPDVLIVDTASAAGFLNGRQPADDVIDAELAVVTGGLFGGSAVLASDCVNANDATLPLIFPYLAAAH
jgi:Domain of unknown function (DUF4331)